MEFPMTLVELVRDHGASATHEDQEAGCVTIKNREGIGQLCAWNEHLASDTELCLRATVWCTMPPHER